MFAVVVWRVVNGVVVQLVCAHTLGVARVLAVQPHGRRRAVLQPLCSARGGGLAKKSLHLAIRNPATSTYQIT